MSDPTDIRAFQRLSPQITTSGRIEAGDIAKLAGCGVTRVINLALDEHPEALANEAVLLDQAGIQYHHIPIPFDAPEEAHYDAFVTALEAAPGPVHVHCIMNWRVSAFFYRYHREHGMAEADARALMRQQWDPIASDDPRAAPWAAICRPMP